MKQYFLICKSMYIWKCIQYTIQWNKTQISSNKINRTENALFFLSQPPTHPSFTFDLRFLCELMHKARISKTVCGITIFDSVLFLLKFMFLFNKMHGLFDFKTS